MTHQNKNKQLAITAYQRIFGDLDVAAVDEFVSANFIQHNPTIPDGPEGIKSLLQMLVAQGTQRQTIEFQHVVAEGDIVILHSRYEMAGKEWRFLDVYRIHSGQLAEHWDAMMQMPDVPANNNPMF